MDEPRRQAWSRPGFGGCRRWPSSTSRSVSKALSNNAPHHAVGAGDIIEAGLDPVGVTKAELCQIPIQMGFAYVLVNPVNPALEDGEASLDRVRVGFVPDVFLDGVVHGFVAFEPASGVGVDVGLVRHEPAVRVCVPGDQRREVVSRHIRDVEHPQPAAALNQCCHRLLGRDWTIGAVRCFSANPGLVSFDGHSFAAEGTSFAPTRLFHGFPNAVTEKPCAFQSDTQDAVELVAAESLLAAANQVHGLQPDLGWDMAGLHDGLHFYSEGFPAIVAFPQAGPGCLTAKFADTIASRGAEGTGRSIRPHSRLDPLKGGFFVLEVDGGEDRGGHGSCSYDQKPNSWSVVCQV